MSVEQDLMSGSPSDHAPLRAIALDDDAFRRLDVRRFNGGVSPYAEHDNSVDLIFSRGPAYSRDTVRHRIGFTGGRVLDLMCGVGNWSIFLAECNDSVVGVDILPACISIARNMSREFGLDNTEFHIGDYREIVRGFPDKSFDYVWVHSGLQYVAREVLLSEAHRLLRESGRIYVGDYNSTGLMISHFLKGVKSGQLYEGSARWAMTALSRGPLANGNPNFLDLDSVEPVLDSLGFATLIAAPSGMIDLTAPDRLAKSQRPDRVMEYYEDRIEFVAEKRPGQGDASALKNKIKLGFAADPSTQRRTIDDVKMMQPPPLTVLGELLGDGNQLVQGNAASTLVEIGPQSCGQLMAILRDGSHVAMVNSVNAFSRLGDDGLRGLLEAAGHADAGVAAFARQKIGEAVPGLPPFGPVARKAAPSPSVLGPLLRLAGSVGLARTAKRAGIASAAASNQVPENNCEPAIEQPRPSGSTRPPRPVTVLQIDTPSYTGATWFSLVLASGKDAFYLGPAERIWRLPASEADNACFVLGANCPVWPSFVRNWDRDGNFVLQLAEHTGKKFFIVYNPSPAFATANLHHPQVESRRIRFVRDGRGTIHSFMRHHAGQYDNVYDACRCWLYYEMLRMVERSPQSHETGALVRYEDACRNPASALSEVSKFTGLELSTSCLRFWEYEHYMTAGNTGVIDTLRAMQGRGRLNYAREDYYGRLIESLKLRPDVPVIDETWQAELTTEDRTAYDFVIGDLHASLGYERDTITSEQKLAFRETHRPPDSLEDALRQAPSPRRRSRN